MGFFWLSGGIITSASARWGDAWFAQPRPTRGHSQQVSGWDFTTTLSLYKFRVPLFSY